MDSRSYYHLLERVQSIQTVSELEELNRSVLECYGHTQRRWAVVTALEERRLDLTRTDAPSITPAPPRPLE
ncbi:MAG TPA: hypothetical protein VJ803_11685 [Gemmatimonadaceae bacterium]|nr:hypothetical protein [Gemmatimonadaceae bacterium]